jgi:hypothetical protein
MVSIDISVSPVKSKTPSVASITDHQAAVATRCHGVRLTRRNDDHFTAIPWRKCDQYGKKPQIVGLSKGSGQSAVRGWMRLGPSRPSQSHRHNQS